MQWNCTPNANQLLGGSSHGSVVNNQFVIVSSQFVGPLSHIHIYIIGIYIYVYIHTLPYITLHYIALRYITIHTLPHIRYHTYVTLHYTTLRYTTLHYTTLHYIHTLHYTTLHYITYIYYIYIYMCDHMCIYIITHNWGN